MVEPNTGSALERKEEWQQSGIGRWLQIACAIGLPASSAIPTESSFLAGLNPTGNGYSGGLSVALTCFTDGDLDVLTLEEKTLGGVCASSQNVALGSRSRKG